VGTALNNMGNSLRISLGNSWEQPGKQLETTWRTAGNNLGNREQVGKHWEQPNNKDKCTSLTSSNLSCPLEVSVGVKLISMEKVKEGSLLNILCNESKCNTCKTAF